MDYRDAWDVLLNLAADYSPSVMPWTSPDNPQDVNDLIARRWVDLFVKYDDNVVATAVAELRRQSPAFCPKFTEMQIHLSAVAARNERLTTALPSGDRILSLPDGLRVALRAYKAGGGVGKFGQWAEDALAAYDATGDPKSLIGFTAWTGERLSAR